MPRPLTSSVGIGGKNLPEDVTTVQELLNQTPVFGGGPLKPIAVDGKIGPETVNAICHFQNTNFFWSDARVDPGRRTHVRLNEYADGERRVDAPLAPSTPAQATPAAGAGKPAGVDGSGNGS